LNADDVSGREEAGRNLAAAGDGAIEPLAAAITSSSAEAAWRASAMLEQIALGSDEATTARACAAIRRLSQSSPGIAGVLKEITIKKAKQRRDKAVAKIRALGGKFAADEDAGLLPAGAP